MVAFSYTEQYRTHKEAGWTVIASADGDTGGDIPHGFGSAPDVVQITPLLADAYTSAWRVTGVDATNITLEKTAGGGGNVAAQLRVDCNLRRHVNR